MTHYLKRLIAAKDIQGSIRELNRLQDQIGFSKSLAKELHDLANVVQRLICEQYINEQAA